MYKVYLQSNCLSPESVQIQEGEPECSHEIGPFSSLAEAEEEKLRQIELYLAKIIHDGGESPSWAEFDGSECPAPEWIVGFGVEAYRSKESNYWFFRFKKS